MTAHARELQYIGIHLAERLEDAARTPDSPILEAVASECEGAARVLRRIAADQRQRSEPA